MKALQSLLIYLFTGVAGVSTAAYFASVFMAHSQAEEKIENTASLEKKSLVKVPELKLEEAITIAQNQKVTKPNENELDKDIVVEGEKDNKFQALDVLRNSFEYDPKGKRDPFAPYETPRAVINSLKPFGPVQPLQKFAVNQLQVKGIIWGVDDPVAMINTPDGEVYYVRERQKIGSNNGYVAQIREGEVVIVESFMFRGNITSQVKILPLNIEDEK